MIGCETGACASLCRNNADLGRDVDTDAVILKLQNKWFNSAVLKLSRTLISFYKQHVYEQRGLKFGINPSLWHVRK